MNEQSKADKNEIRCVENHRDLMGGVTPYEGSRKRDYRWKKHS